MMKRSFSILTALALAVMMALPATAQPPSSMTKQQIHSEMLALAQSKNPANIARYEELSAFTGGDRPGQSGPGPSGNVSVRGTAAPPNCSMANTAGANNTPVAIADVATSSSTINIAGANPFLFNVTVTANVSHTFAADMDITLISPAGTRVTLSTDNGAGNDDVFAGTTWDDGAALPTTDAVYANLVVQPLLIPEEAMDAFYGEDPNGTWTFEVVDDLTGDVGTINSWSLSINALAVAPTPTTTTVTNNTPVAIIDVASSSSNISVSGAGTFLCRLTVNTNITHTFAADMDITLAGPTRTTTMSTDNGAGNDNVFNGTLWDNDGNTPVTDFVFANLVTATPVVPEGSYGAFQTIDPNGTWTLTVVDDLTGDVGSIDSWTVNATTCECPIPDADLSLTKTAAPTAVGVGDPVVFTLTASNAGPANATGVVVTDTLPAGLTYVSNDCGAAFAAPTLTWNIGALANGASAVCNVTVTVNAAGSHTNNATIDGDQTDPVPANNASAELVSGQQNVLEIPTLSGAGIAAMFLGLGLAALWVLRRRS